MLLNIKNEVLLRVYTVAGIVAMMAVLVFFKLSKLSVLEGEKWRTQAQQTYFKTRKVKADRGNILDINGNLLATSLPFFDIRFDPKTEGLSDAIFAQNVDSLAYFLATEVFDSTTQELVRDWLWQLRQAPDTVSGIRYIKIADDVQYQKMRRIRTYPLFREKRFVSGLIVEQKAKRDRPYKGLAQRSIGYVREGAMPVGLEGRFNNELGGLLGEQVVMRVPGNYYIPVNDLNMVEPKAGSDVVSTLDINIQEVAENALLSALQKHDADHGCAVVMEVETGAIRAIANLGRTSRGGWWETYNYAVGERVEPGSMFKTASFLAMLEDGVIEDFNTQVPVFKGSRDFYEETLIDSHKHGLDSMSVKSVFAESSNVGTASLVQDAYGTRAGTQNFLNRLKSFGLDLPTNVEIDGEELPFFKDPNNKEQDFSGTTLPWMSIGYELLMSPLQCLQFYNTIANDGRLMKPYIVDRIERYGKVEKKFHPKVINRRIAKMESIKEVQGLLEAVVQPGGTASKIRPKHYNIAGKTGTAQLNYHKFKAKKGIRHQAGFCGYFPADNPVYSCIVVISEPKKAGYHGSEVAAPVFRRIADRCFALKAEMKQPVNAEKQPRLAEKALPAFHAGNKKDMKQALRWLGIEHEDVSNTNWVVTNTKADTLLVENRPFSEKKVPSVIGMGLKDALFILENLGLHARVKGKGFGKVIRQGVPPGTRVNGQQITLVLR